MKNRLFRALILCLALVLLLQVGAFSAVAATQEEIAQYEHDLALYRAWQTYREQEAAYYAYQEYLANGVHQHEAYLQYQGVLAQIESKVENLDYIFIKDNRGWALIESIDIGVAAVEQFASDPENMSRYEDLIGELSSVLTKAKYSSETLKEIFGNYSSITYASYASELERLKACYNFYKANYSSLISNSNELYKDLYSFYAKSNVVIRNAVDKKEKDKNMQGRYLRLVAQLAVLYYCLDDGKNLPDPDFVLFPEIMYSLNLTLESSQIMTDGNDANPSFPFPSAEVEDVLPVDPVEKPIKPTGAEITVEPTKPAGYIPGGGSGGSGESGGGSSGGGGGSSDGGGGIPTEPIQESDRPYATERDLQQNVAIRRATTIRDGDAEAILSIEAESALIKAGVKAVSISLAATEEGETITFSASGGSLSAEEPVFCLVLSDGDNEEYRYAYFRKSEEDWEALSGESALVSLSDEVLRCKSFYLRPAEDVDDENCNLKSLPISALPGETVQIDPQCDFGYEIVNLIVRTKDGEEILVDRKEFIMPYGPVTISFEVVKILYHVQFFVDGVLVAERDYGLGEEILPPELETVPTKESDGEYNYTFIGWETEQKTAVGSERELKAEARFAKTAINNGEEFYDLRMAFLKPILLAGGVFVAIGLAVFFLIRYRKKKKKQS